MHVYRFCRKRRAEDLSGTGAKLVGGRWNSQGIPAVYTSENRALALAEYWVHVNPSNLPADVCIVEITVPDTSEIQFISRTTLPDSWRAFTPQASLKKTGDRWLLDGNHLILKVPSVVMPLEFNYILNPMHRDMSSVRIVSITDYEWDQRMGR